MSKILITGANGQLGTELHHLLDERGITYDARDAKDMDITDRQAVEEQVTALSQQLSIIARLIRQSTRQKTKARKSTGG